MVVWRVGVRSKLTESGPVRVMRGWWVGLYVVMVGVGSGCMVLIVGRWTWKMEVGRVLLALCTKVVVL